MVYRACLTKEKLASVANFLLPEDLGSVVPWHWCFGIGEAAAVKKNAI